MQNFLGQYIGIHANESNKVKLELNGLKHVFVSHKYSKDSRSITWHLKYRAALTLFCSCYHAPILFPFFRSKKLFGFSISLILINLASILERADENLLPAVYKEVSAAFDVGPTDLGYLT